MLAMVETQFKSIFRFNRLLVLTLVGLTVAQMWHHPGWGGKAILMSLAVVHFGFLMGNEFLLKVVKRLRDAELQTVLHLSVFIPVVLALYTTINYLLTGSFLVYSFGLFAVLQAQFLGQTKLSKILMAWHGVLLLGSIPLSYPRSFTLGLAEMIVTAVAWGACLYAYGLMLSSLLRSHSTQVGKLQSMAATDALTGLTNRRQFNSRLHEEIARARRHEAPLTLALFDLDDFKRLNDFYGHPVGDRILRELGRLIRNNIRESDLAARYGGEEFALILPETRETEAYELLERIRLLVSQTVFCLPENPLTITISVGVAQLDPRHHTAFELVELADKALYEAKKQGKNQVVRGSALMPKVIIPKTPIRD